MIRIINGDCIEEMKSIPDCSIDMVCADIPYGTTQCKWDSVIDLQQMWEQINRVAKTNAAIVLFSAQPFTSILVSSNLKNWKSELIWEKPHATGFLNAKKQLMRAHENIQIFYRKQPTYNPQMTHGHERKSHKPRSFKSECYGETLADTSYDSTSRYPRDVQKFSSDKQRSSLHPTQKPLALVKYLIETFSNHGDIVLDFTMGSGTAGVACQDVGRGFIGIEKDPDIFMIATKRIKQNQPS